MPKGLEKALEQKVKPVVDKAVKQALGVKIAELSEDISKKLQNPLAGFLIDPTLPFKQAKKLFKQEYVKKLLRINYGNISEVARIVGLDRRSVHRLIKESSLNVGKIRQDMEKSYDVRQQRVSHIITDVLDSYRQVLHPERLLEAYHHVEEMSKTILDELPEEPIPLNEAEELFEDEYLHKALAVYGQNIAATAKRIGLRYETLQRKCKRLGLL